VRGYGANAIDKKNDMGSFEAVTRKVDKQIQCYAITQIIGMTL